MGVAGNPLAVRPLTPPIPCVDRVRWDDHHDLMVAGRQIRHERRDAVAVQITDNALIVIPWILDTLGGGAVDRCGFSALRRDLLDRCWGQGQRKRCCGLPSLRRRAARLHFRLKQQK